MKEPYPLHAAFLYGLLVGVVALYVYVIYLGGGLKGCHGATPRDDFQYLMMSFYYLGIVTIPFCAVIGLVTCALSALVYKSKAVTVAAFAAIVLSASIAALWIAQLPCVKMQI
jgi:hypothetical protein